MSRTGIIIQARMGSTRLPGKVLYPIYDVVGMLDHLVRKCQKYPLVVAYPWTEQNYPIQELCDRLRVLSFAGPENDVLSRFLGAATNRFETIIRVTADNPLTQIDYFWGLTKRMSSLNWDYMTLWLDGKPSPVHGSGIFPEAVTLGALKSLDVILPRDDPQREHVTQGIYTRPDLFKLSKVVNQLYEKALRGKRYTVDTPEDMERMRDLFRINGLEFGSDMKSIVQAEEVTG